MGFSRQEVGWVEEARTERDGEGTAGCASFRPTSWARAARLRAARGRRQAAVSTSKNRAAGRGLTLQVRPSGGRARLALALGPSHCDYVLYLWGAAIIWSH
jgi:hypothetical protein